ncbi:MAG: hypothetical protein ACUVXF_06360 [Desulfobaccales bacterium]
MNCDRCGCQLEAADRRHHAGQELCEDCYLEALHRPQACDPWAVHIAKGDKGRTGLQLTPVQQKLYDLVKDRGKVLISEAAASLGLSEDELRREFATLRHLELLRGQKEGLQVFITLF